MQSAMQYAMHTKYIKCHIIYMEVCNMAFQLKSNRKQSENKTIRFPISLIEKIESAIENKDTNFSSFVLQACEYALENMDTD